MEENICPGSGRRWMGGMGRPICPVCHRSAKALGVPQPRPVVRGMTQGKWQGLVPTHQARRP